MIKTAQLATGRAGVLAFEGGYHGLTLGSLAATSRELFRRPFEGRLYPGVSFVPFPDARLQGPGAAEACLRRIGEVLAEGAPGGTPIGAVLVEPIQGRAGVRMPPPGFMSALSTLAAEAGTLVVADEVLTGMGRCGPMLASELVGLRPDIVCLGKALGSGMPVSACFADSAVMAAWPGSGGEAIHTSTFLGHPLSCAAALAALKAVGPEERAAAATTRGALLLRMLRERLADAPGVGEVRGAGLLLGIELTEHDGVTPAEGAAVRVATAALARGVIVLPAGEHGQVVELAPPLVLTDAQINCAVEVLVEAVTQAVPVRP